MRITLTLLMLLAGCESMEPSGQPLEPAKGAAPAPAPAAAPTGPADADFALLERETFTVSSEELMANAEDAPEEATPGADLAAPEASPEPEPAAPEIAPPPAAAPAALPTSVLAGVWPVRLVSTLPAAQPPRAILALSDGAEIVVSPGDLLPAERLVVLAIGDGTLQAARVTPVGDHATVDAITLTSQY